MDIHKPKPWHGVREFLKEYIIIVVGVLTALGAEQTVEALHERGLAREAREAIDAEVQDNVNRIAYRQAQQPCIDKRLQEITGLLADWADGKPPPRALFLGDPGDPPMVQQRWQANLNSGRFNRQTEAEQSKQAAFYTQLAILQDMESREHYVWSELRTLELGPRVLRPDLRPNLVASLQAARSDASDIRQLGQDILASAARAGHTPKPFGVTAILGTTCQPLNPPAVPDT
ncbi:hypothetical protein [Phenylobacterium sp.]|jgi:hypothetical protein|uniref:hypothetical protein n=1 Tax=Phenylobacterium sp. TaxID=1871053 RepID=UPI002E3757DE|nr:hypothetical protein [Phenylobacterium sp.]HEX3367670.1 hypothetical protein [Phenylobacterium sp.]